MLKFNDYLKEAALSAKQKKIAAIAGDKDKIDADDLAALRAGKKPVDECDYGKMKKEELIGNQKKLDKNHNGKLDAQDFKMLRKEDAKCPECGKPMSKCDCDMTEEVELEEGYDKSSENHKNARKMAKDYDGKATFHPNGHAEVRMRSIVHGHSTINPQGTTLMSGEDLANRASKEHGKGKVQGNVVHFKEANLDEKSDQARRNKTYKNLMAASKGARVNRLLGMTPADTGHKNNQQMNKAIGRAISRGEVHEAATGNPGKGYHGACGTADEKYEQMHKHVKNLTDGDDKTVKHYLDSGHGEKLAGREADHDHIKADFKKFMKYYRPEMHDPKTVNVEKINAAGDKPHEEKFETVKKTKVKEETRMKTYKEFVQSLDEKLVGGQKKLDKNHNGKLDAQDFKMLRKEETEALDEIKLADLPVRKIQGKSYGASYEDPEGAFETKDDMKKPEKAGRKTGQRTGSYKPRKTMSKLKAAGATYK